MDTLSCWISPPLGEIVNFTPLIFQFPCLAQGPIPMGEADDMSITSSSLVLQLVVLSLGSLITYDFALPLLVPNQCSTAPVTEIYCPPPRPLSRWPSRCCKSLVCPGGQLVRISIDWYIREIILLYQWSLNRYLANYFEDDISAKIEVDEKMKSNMAARNYHPRIPSPKYGQTARSETAKHKSRFAVFGKMANPPSC